MKSRLLLFVQRIALFSLLNVLLLPVFGQMSINWNKSYGSDGEDNVTEKIIYTDFNSRGGKITFKDGFLYFSAYVDTSGKDVHRIIGAVDSWIVKTDTNGDTVWTTSVGDTNHIYYVNQIRVDENNAVWVAGSRMDMSQGGLATMDGFIKKISADGDSIETIYETGIALVEASDFITDFLLLPNDELIFCGATSSAYLTGNFVLADSIKSNSRDAWVSKLQRNGTVKWSKRFALDDPRFQFESEAFFWQNIVELQNGEFALCGGVNYNVGTAGVSVFAKIDSSGNELWMKLYGANPGSVADEAIGGVQLKGDTLLFASNISSGGGEVIEHIGGKDIWLVTIASSDGALIGSHQRTLGTGYLDRINEIKKVSTEQIFLVGDKRPNGSNSSNADIYLMEINSDLELVDSLTITGSSKDIAASVAFDRDNELIYLLSESSSDNGDFTGATQALTNIWVTEISKSLDLGLEKIPAGSIVSIFPNPVRSGNVLNFTTPDKFSSLVDILIFDVYGQLVDKIDGGGSVHYRVNLAPGTYFVKVNSGNTLTETRKLLILK